MWSARCCPCPRFLGQPSASILLLAALLALPAQTARSASGSEPVEIRFAPVDSMRWILSAEEERTEDFDQRAPRKVQRSTVVDTLRFVETESGWIIHRSFGPRRLQMDGVDRGGEIFRLLRGRVVEIHCDRKGVAGKVKGYRRIFRILERELDPPDWRLAQAMYQPEAAEATERRFWNHRRGGLVGARAVTGEIWSYRDVVPTGSGEVEIRGTLRFDGSTEFEGRHAYKLVFEFGPGTPEPEAGAASPTVDLRPEGSVGNHRVDLGMKGQIVQMVDRSTGMVLYEHRDLRWDEARPAAVGGRTHIHQSSIFRLRRLGG